MNEKDYKRWLNFSMIICENNKDLAQNTLHEVLESFLKVKSIENYNDNYIFMSIRNRYLNYIKKKNLTQKLFDDKHNEYDNNEYIEEEDYNTYLDSYINNNEKTQIRLEVISETIMTLQSYEKKLYYLHFIVGKSQREIARSIGVTIRVVNYRINKIKDKIRNNYEQGN